MNQLEHRELKAILVAPPAVGWPQLATYPQSPFSGPACCCDLAYLSQAFSQPTGPGRLWISLGASLLFVPTEKRKARGVPLTKRKPAYTQKSRHFRTSSFDGRRCCREARSQNGTEPDGLGTPP